MKKIFFVFVFLFAISVQVYTQYELQDHQDIAVDISVTPKGDAYVTGYTNSTIWEIMTIKYNSSGKEIWRKYYEGEIGIGAKATAIKVDEKENIFVTGVSLDTLTATNIVTIKYDSSGQLNWVTIYNSPDSNDDQAESMCIDKFGHVYVTGISYRDSGSYNYITVKYDVDGKLLWKNEYDGPAHYDDMAKSISVDQNQNVYVTGTSYHEINYYDYITIKYNEFGTQNWISRYDGPFHGGDIATSLLNDSDGNVFVTGYSFNGESNHHDFCTVKYDSSGTEEFVKTYNRGVNSSSQAIKIISDYLSNIYVVGWNSLSGPYWDIITLKYRNNGLLIWTNVYDAGYKDVPSDIISDKIGNIYITGYSENINAVADYTTIKYDTAGNQQWSINYNGPVNDWDAANAIDNDTLGNIYITGYSYGEMGLEYATIKYDNLGNVIWIQRSGNIPNTVNENDIEAVSFSLFQNFPNPFNPSTKIKYTIPTPPSSSPLATGRNEVGFVTLKVFDVLGKEVATLVNEEKPAGDYEIDFNASYLASGIYYYQLRAGEYVETKKMVLLK